MIDADDFPIFDCVLKSTLVFALLVGNYFKIIPFLSTIHKLKMVLAQYHVSSTSRKGTQ